MDTPIRPKIDPRKPRIRIRVDEKPATDAQVVYANAEDLERLLAVGRNKQPDAVVREILVSSHDTMRARVPLYTHPAPSQAVGAVDAKDERAAHDEALSRLVDLGRELKERDARAEVARWQAEYESLMARKPEQAVGDGVAGGKDGRVPPRWYTLQEIEHCMQRMSYSDAVIAELAPWFFRHIKSAFAKGYNMALNNYETTTPRPAVATPAEVTDEMVLNALTSFDVDIHAQESKGYRANRTEAMREALIAALASPSAGVKS